jgi:hypothetical protein
MAEVGNVHGQAGATTERRCDNPECSERLIWSGRQGRPQLFCSTSCRKRAVYAAEALAQQVAAKEFALASPLLTYRQAREVRSDLARLEWQLSSYPASARPTT